MFDSLKGKRVLITGSSSGIGAETAKLFGRYGARVGVHYRGAKAEAQKVARAIKTGSGETRIFQADLLKKGAADKLIASFVKAFGSIDVLVNNAGACFDYRHFSELKEVSWDKTMDLNAKAPFLLSRAAFNFMKTNNWGRIVNISTNSIKYGGVSNMHYYASKAALDALTSGFSREGVKYNILVNSIRCGLIDTPMRTKIAGYTEEDFKKRAALVPLGRAGQPADIARLILFLASAGGDFITGEVLSVAGGE